MEDGSQLPWDHGTSNIGGHNQEAPMFTIWDGIDEYFMLLVYHLRERPSKRYYT